MKIDGYDALDSACKKRWCWSPGNYQHRGAWEQVQRSEAADPRMLRALRQQQEFLQSQGAL